MYDKKKLNIVKIQTKRGQFKCTFSVRYIGQKRFTYLVYWCGRHGIKRTNTKKQMQRNKCNETNAKKTNTKKQMQKYIHIFNNILPLAYIYIFFPISKQYSF